MREVKMHTLYRHCKCTLYYIIGEECDSDSIREMVMHHGLYGENYRWVRTKDEFLSLVEEQEENLTGQKYRFEVFQD